MCRKSEERLTKLKVVLARLPPPHYRTTKYLFSHLHTMAQKRTNTGMDSRNLAIVWSPNLMKYVMSDSNRNTITELMKRMRQLLYLISVTLGLDCVCDGKSFRELSFHACSLQLVQLMNNWQLSPGQVSS